MKSLEARFLNVQKRNPNFSTYLCFAEAVRGQNFNPKIIARWYNKLIDGSDNLKSDKKFVLAHLVDITNPREACQKQAQINSQGNETGGSHV